MLTLDITSWGLLLNKVNDWSYYNAHHEYYYGSRSSYWTMALKAEVITQEEYDYAQNRYKNLSPNVDLWNYILK